MTAPTLWHYTCHHGHLALGQAGSLIPPLALGARYDALPPWARDLGYLVWATDLGNPWPEPLGLTRHLGGCDRTEYRYRVTDPAALTPYLDTWRTLDPRLARTLVMADGAMPRHWWVSRDPVPVAYDPTPPP